MKERDIIFAAKIVSALFNPFYLPVIGLIPAGHHLGVYVYRSSSHFPHSSLSSLSGMVIDRIRSQGTPYGALCHCHCLLRILLLSHAIPPYSPFHGKHCDGRLDYPGCLWFYQSILENKHAYSSHRRRNGSSPCVFLRLLL